MVGWGRGCGGCGARGVGGPIQLDLELHPSNRSPAARGLDGRHGARGVGAWEARRRRRGGSVGDEEAAGRRPTVIHAHRRRSDPTTQWRERQRGIGGGSGSWGGVGGQGGVGVRGGPSPGGRGGGRGGEGPRGAAQHRDHGGQEHAGGTRAPTAEGGRRLAGSRGGDPRETAPGPKEGVLTGWCARVNLVELLQASQKTKN